MDVAMNPVVLHIVRPYENEAEYLSAEAWTIEARGMLLVDQEPLDNDASVVFDVTLGDGSKPIRAEGRVVGHLAATEDRPGGVRIRFRRFGAQTKSFVERAVNEREAQLARRSQPPPSAVATSVAPAAPVPANASAADQAPAERAAPAAALPPAAMRVSDAPPVFTPEASTKASAALPAQSNEPSGIHRRPGVSRVSAPPNRDELLDRLRQRFQATLASAPDAADGTSGS